MKAITFSLLLTAQVAVAFTPCANKRSTLNASPAKDISVALFSSHDDESIFDRAFNAKSSSSSSSTDSSLNASNNKIVAAGAASATAFLSSVGVALADSDLDSVEIAELPPPYVPIIFAIAILGGVGILTGSLGDVMSEEASLGLMSGAQAKKEKERSRSSYFKKR